MKNRKVWYNKFMKVLNNKRQKKVSKSIRQSKNNLNKSVEDITNFLKIISEKHRFKILYILRDDKKCVYHIWKSLCIPQNLTSHHLKVLKDFELILSERQGAKIFYKLNQKNIKNYLNLLDKFLK